jgi:hypothetical protein
VKIPKTQPLPGNSQRCHVSVVHRGLVEGRLAVLAQLEATHVGPL